MASSASSSSASSSKGHHQVGQTFKDHNEPYVEPICNGGLFFFSILDLTSSFPLSGSKYLNFHVNYRKLAIWAVLQALFAYVEFGTVFFIVSLMYFIYANLGDHGNVDAQGQKQKSAYSVFNKNQERLPGTLTAEEIDKQLRTGFF